MNKLIEQYFNGSMNQQERLQLLHRIEEDMRLKEAFIETKKIHTLLSLQEQPNDRAEGITQYKKFFSEKPAVKPVYRLLQITQYAAVIVAVMVSTWFTSSFYYQQNDKEELTFNSITVPAGQRASVTLHDGTTVWLNAKSTLKYPSRFEKEKREVELIGEGFFTVTKDNHRPFIVSAKTIEVKVLGTTFNMYCYPEVECSAVSLINGAVEVYSTKNPDISVRLEPNQKVLYYQDNLSLTNLDENDFLWKEGIYSFEKTSLTEIIKKLELYYDSEIIISNPEIGKYTYTGKFRQRDGVNEILKILQKIHKFQIEKDEVNNRYVLK